MNNFFNAVSSVVLFTTVFSGHAYAQYAGPNVSQQTRTVSDILKNPVDDRRIILDGYILRKVSHEKYIFSDGTGDIRVEIDDDKLPGSRFDEKTKVQIHGEVDVNYNRSPEIDVDAVIVK